MSKSKGVTGVKAEMAEQRAVIVEAKRRMAQLERAEEILTSKRGITGAPAVERPLAGRRAKPKKNGSKPAEVAEAGGYGLGHGPLQELLRAVLIDGRHLSATEMATELPDEKVTSFYAALRKMPDVQEDRSTDPITFYIPSPKRRLTVIRPGEGISTGRIAQ